MISAIILQVNQAATIVADTLARAINQLPLTPPPAEIKLSIMDLTVKGGPLMIPIALLSVIGIYIFIERFIVINKASREDVNFMNNIRDFIHNGRLDSAQSLCRNNQTPIARMIEKGLNRLGRPLNDINAAIENVG